MTALVMLLVIVMIDGDSGDSGSEVTISDSGGRGGVTSEAAVRKSGSYGVERTERGASEEPVRKNKGGPWRMVGDGAIVVYRRLIINPQ